MGCAEGVGGVCVGAHLVGVKDLLWDALYALIHTILPAVLGAFIAVVQSAILDAAAKRMAIQLRPVDL